MKSIKLNDKDVFLEIGTYAYGDRLAVLSNIVDEPFSDVTINLPELYLDSNDEGFIDTTCKECGLYQKLVDEGIIKETIKSGVSYNMEKYDLVRFDMDKLREYDPKGYEEFLDEICYDKNVSSNPSI